MSKKIIKFDPMEKPKEIKKCDCGVGNYPGVYSAHAPNCSLHSSKGKNWNMFEGMTEGGEPVYKLKNAKITKCKYKRLCQKKN